MTHQDYIDGYMDGRDPNSPQPNLNRSLRYCHSFAIGRSEINNTRGMTYDQCMKRVEEIERIEESR